MITDTGLPNFNPKVNEVVYFRPWMTENDSKKKPYPVIINSGRFYKEDGTLSNFWHWQRVGRVTGRINPNIECGYGKFTKATGYTVERKVVVKKAELITVR